MASIPSKLIPGKTEYRTCSQCQKTFLAYIKASRKFCSSACYFVAKRQLPTERVCLVCHQTFSPREMRQVICSIDCRTISNRTPRKRETRTCPQCHGTFQVLPSDPQIYCSRSCSAIAVSNGLRKQYPTKICEECGKPFEWRRHDTTGKYCSRDCASTSWRKRAPDPMPWLSKFCLHCGQTFQVPPWHPSITFCSVACAKRNEAVWKRGDRHPLWKPKAEMFCEVCGTSRMVKPSLVKRFRACSRRCANILGQMTYPRTSSIEAAMSDAFARIKLMASPQVVIGPYIVDFALPDAQIVVECDGTYWHGRPEQKVRDKRKDTYLRNHGWIVIRLTEEAINESPDDCAMKVQRLYASRVNQQHAVDT